jgi:hypothetical protein
LALTGFSGEVFILDITDSESPTVTGLYLPNEGEIQFQSLRGHTYLAIGPRGYKMPSQVLLDWQPDENLNAKSGADMLVISPALFGEVLQPLIELRQRQGLRVRVVPVEAIYDQYGYGFPEPEAIREFILSTQRTWDPVPRYLLIVGDATYDPRGYISTANTTMIPSFFVDTEFGGETVSDLFYAQVDEDVPPDLAVGRIPAQNIKQLRTMIEKIILYERQSLDDDWTARILAIADGQEPGFQADAEQFLSKYTDAYQTTLFAPVFGDDQSASAIEAFINDGFGVISYFGHGSVGLWGKDRLLTSEQVAQLSNPRYPIILNMTCLTGYFINPKMSSITEAFLWQADSGAVAVIAPTSLTLAADQSFLSQSFAQAQSSTTYQRLGDLFLYIQNQIPLDRVGRREVLLTYMLFGDPAMQIPQP